MNTYLEKILAAKKEKIEARVLFLENIRRNTEKAELTGYHYFRNNISSGDKINFIAEIKRLLVKRADPPRVRGRPAVEDLSRGRGRALSVLTEETFFLGRPIISGSPRILTCRLAKDFFIDELQIYEAFSYGAKAILLIMAILTDGQVKRMIDIASRLDMDCLVEVHSEEELKRAIDCGADVIGVNNRDLSTFAIDFDLGEKLLRKIPDGRVKVIESGIQDREDVRRFQVAGANAVLIGETFMRAADVGAKVRELMA
jgi:indole-3-glycerol phosphate synthase